MTFPKLYAAGDQINADDLNADIWNSKFTYGATIAVGDPLYLKASDGKAYKALATTQAHVDDFIGIAMTAGVANDTNYVCPPGKLAVGLSGLTQGTPVYLSDTGTLSSSRGTIAFVLGVAISTTSMLVQGILDIEDVKLNIGVFTAGESISAGEPVYIPQSTATSATAPGTAADDSAVGSLSWTNPNNIKVDDGNYATVTAGQHSGVLTTHYAKGTNFGFAIPSTATVVGIVASIKRYWGTGGGDTYVIDNRVRIVKSDGSIGSYEQANGTNWPGSDTAQGYGSATDLWGETWTPADINNSNFGLALSANIHGTDGAPAVTTGYVGFFSLTVYYAVARQVLRASASATTVKGFCGFAKEAATVGNNIRVVRPGGIIGGLSNLQQGKFYYIANTTGTIATTQGTNRARVGLAISTTELEVMHDVDA